MRVFGGVADIADGHGEVAEVGRTHFVSAVSYWVLGKRQQLWALSQ